MNMTHVRSTLVVIAALLLGAGSAQAVVIATAQEESGNVVVTFSGTIALDSLPAPDFLNNLTHGVSVLSVDPSTPGFAFEPPGTRIDGYSLSVTGTPPPFGASSIQTIADSRTGDYFFWQTDGTSATLVLPHGYAGEVLSGSMTFDGATFASLGIAHGTSEWSWSNGRSSDKVVFGVPDTASTLALLGGALVGLAAFRRRFAS